MLSEAEVGKDGFIELYMPFQYRMLLKLNDPPHLNVNGLMRDTRMLKEVSCRTNCIQG